MQADLAKEQQAAAATKSSTQSDFEKKVAWAAKTQIKGDVRIRQENIDIAGEADNGGRDKDRQRVRARLGAYTEINPQVDSGIRIATGGGNDARSTNQDLDGYFSKKSIWLDLAYIDYHPTAIQGLSVIGGKMTADSKPATQATGAPQALHTTGAPAYYDTASCNRNNPGQGRALGPCTH